MTSSTKCKIPFTDFSQNCDFTVHNTASRNIEIKTQVFYVKLGYWEQQNGNPHLPTVTDIDRKIGQG